MALTPPHIAQERARRWNQWVEKKMTMKKELNERPLEDNYPLHVGYLYVVGDRVFQNWPGFKTVKEMRDDLVRHEIEKQDVVIKSCDIGGRDMWEFAI